MAVDLDCFYSEMAEFGLYQKLVVGLLMIPGCVMFAFRMNFAVFVIHTPNFRCKESEDDFEFQLENTTSSVVNTSCAIGYIYDKSNFESTVVTDWQLVGDRAFHVRVAMMVRATSAPYSTKFSEYEDV